MAFGRNTRHALHCRRSPPTLLPASQEESRFTEQCLSTRSDSCIRQCGLSTTARLCPQHQHTLNNPSLALQLYAEQTSQSSFLSKRIQKHKGENRSGTIYTSGPVVADLINGLNIYLSQVLNYIEKNLQCQRPNLQ